MEIHNYLPQGDPPNRKHPILLDGTALSNSIQKFRQRIRNINFKIILEYWADLRNQSHPLFNDYHEF